MSAGIDKEMLDMTIAAIREFSTGRLTDDKLLEYDEKDEFPIDIVQEMCGEGLGIHLLFIPEEFQVNGAGIEQVFIGRFKHFHKFSYWRNPQGVLHCFQRVSSI